jgi:CubicO group peptidase (beta-lactamase class C family)
VHAITSDTREFSVSYVYDVPVQGDDGLEVGHLNEFGLDQTLISELIDRVASEYYENVHAILIYKNGKLVFEEYFPGERYLYSTAEEVITEYTRFDRFTRHRLSSTTKSFTTTLLGIAIDRGYIGSEEDYIIDYLPEYADLLTDGKEEIKIKHLAGMCAGLSWNEGNFPTVLDTGSDLIKAFQSDDPFGYLFAKPLVNEPGTAFYYNSWLMMALGKIVRTTSGKLVEDFAREYLFDPLGVTDFAWTGGELAETSGGLYIRPRDLLKFGVMYLNGGNWQGTQIVADDWVSKATANRFPFDSDGRSGYGYGWWTRTHLLYTNNDLINSMKAYHGGGWGGQFIFVFPDYDLVVAMNAGNYSIPSAQYPNYDMMSRFLLPAVVR